MPVEVDDDHRPRQPPSLRPRLQRLAQELGVQVPALAIAVDEDGRRAQVTNRIDAGDEGECRREHLVAGAHAQRAQAKVNGCGSTPERHGGQADALLELPLELVDVRTHRAQPVGGEGSADELLLAPAHVRHRQQDALHCGSSARTRATYHTLRSDSPATTASRRSRRSAIRWLDEARVPPERK